MAFDLFVNGTLMRGLALHANLDGATFLGAFRTAPRYRVCYGAVAAARLATGCDVALPLLTSRARAAAVDPFA